MSQGVVNRLQTNRAYDAVTGWLASIQSGVRGWADLESDAKKNQWIKDYSDHSLMYFEVLA